MTEAARDQRIVHGHRTQVRVSVDFDDDSSQGTFAVSTAKTKVDSLEQQQLRQRCCDLVLEPVWHAHAAEPKLELLPPLSHDQRIRAGDLLDSVTDLSRDPNRTWRRGPSRSRLVLLPVVLAEEIEERRADPLVSPVAPEVASAIGGLDFLKACF
jgi:hypothetical protein